jgi:hypothetical protein
MATKLTRLTYEIAIQLHLVAEGCTIYSSRCRRPVRKLLDTPSYFHSWFGAWLSSATKLHLSCRSQSLEWDDDMEVGARGLL